MYTLQMQTTNSDKWYTVGMFNSQEAAKEHIRVLREFLRGVSFQLVV